MGSFCYSMGGYEDFWGNFDPKIWKSKINLLNRGVERSIQLDTHKKQISQLSSEVIYKTEGFWGLWGAWGGNLGAILTEIRPFCLKKHYKLPKPVIKW